MATRFQLVQALAPSLGVPAKTLDVCARYVREAGMIAQKGRGPSAAQMGPTDATNLVLAIMSSDTLEDSPACARRARELECFGLERNLSGDVVEIANSPLRAFLQGARLGAVLERIFDYSARRGDLLLDDGRLLTNVHLEIDRPGIVAEISFDDGDDVWVAKFGVPISREHEVMPFIRPYRAMRVRSSLDLIHVLGDVIPVLLGREPEEGEVVVPPWESAVDGGKRKRSAAGRRRKRK